MDKFNRNFKCIYFDYSFNIYWIFAILTKYHIILYDKEVRNIKTVILAILIVLFLLIIGNKKDVTTAQTVSELHPVFSYEDATIVAESLK